MPRITTLTPTSEQYSELQYAYDHFNDHLFGGELPGCLITMQRQKKSNGFFHGNRFVAADGKTLTDEIALDPFVMKQRPARATLATLAHEMAHLWQHHFGKPSRSGHHNAEWAAKMIAIGLHPSDTGMPGGKITGQKVTHYIVDGGRFDRACHDLLNREGFKLPFVQSAADPAKAAKKRASKTKFTCPCCEAAAWGKPTLRIFCGECDERMLPADAGGDEETDTALAA